MDIAEDYNLAAIEDATETLGIPINFLDIVEMEQKRGKKKLIYFLSTKVFG